MHVDEDLAQFAILELASVQIDLVAAHGGFLDIALASVGQLAALGGSLDIFLHHTFDDALLGDHRAAHGVARFVFDGVQKIVERITLTADGKACQTATGAGGDQGAQLLNRARSWKRQLKARRAFQHILARFRHGETRFGRRVGEDRPQLGAQDFTIIQASSAVHIAFGRNDFERVHTQLFQKTRAGFVKMLGTQPAPSRNFRAQAPAVDRKAQRHAVAQGGVNARKPGLIHAGVFKLGDPVGAVTS